MPAHLRLHAASAEADYPQTRPSTVRVSLGDLLPLVALAQRHNYLWLRDFLDDEVRISEDLYEVLRAFQSYRPSA
jgi:hypothetical protein